ncbi:hypothetical protein IFM89_007035 [Coptis chinensis]|uniref:Aminotransferase-like plant mobile domain-containing protein n=1 Tax=Coptis chinensis TaxID=261450 RepID=A0A835II88_9MAGN|nr:hypothetical protein IFM89_007035 [Coptis chinensis]
MAASSRSSSSSHGNIIPGEVDIPCWIVENFNDSEIHAFAGYSLGNSHGLLPFELDWVTMKLVLKYWNSSSHTFQFGDSELVPTVKEFATLLGIIDQGELVRAPWDEMRSYPHSSEPHRYSSPSAVIQAPNKVIALCVYVLDKVLLFNRASETMSLIPLVTTHSLGINSNIAALVLAKTIIGLDNTTNDQPFTGSPQLLWTQPMGRPRNVLAMYPHRISFPGYPSETHIANRFRMVQSYNINWRTGGRLQVISGYEADLPIA